MSYELLFEFDDEAKTLVSTFFTKTKSRMSSLALQGKGTARIFRVQSGQTEQALFIKFNELPNQMTVITSSLIIASHASPSSDMFDALCSVCSNRYVTEDERPLLNIVHKFDTARFTDVVAAIGRSRLHQYESNSLLAHEVSMKTSTLSQVVDYWKYAK
jgi:hypothetical protein